MKGLLMMEQVQVPQEFIASMYAHFQDVGEKGFEGVALWAGVIKGTCFEVQYILFPEQELRKSPSGLSYTVGAEELHRINVWLYENKMRLIAQIHSHPTEAYHSEVDEEYPIITTVGGLSIVVPDFGFRDNNLQQSAFFRLQPGKGWIELSIEEKMVLLKIIP